MNGVSKVPVHGGGLLDGTPATASPGGPRQRARVTADALLALSEDGYRTVARQSSVALFLLDAEGVIVDANPATTVLLGRSEDELVGLTLSEITPPADLEQVRAQLAAALAGGASSYRRSRRYLRPDVTTVHADVAVSLLRDEDGRPVGFLATAVDDTERAAAEARAHEAAAFLRATVDSLIDPWVYLLAVRDEEGRVIDFEYADVNQAACEHNGVAREHLIGRRLLDVMPDHRGEQLERYAAVLDTGVPLAEDDVAYPTGGTQRYFSNRAVAVGADGLSLTWRDTTEQVELRRELARRATSDPLTGLLNRAGLDEAAGRLGTPDRRSADGMAVLYVDLDGLGEINRRHGHAGGDETIVAVADRLAGTVRAGDVVARVGGDEFVILAPGAGRDGARVLASKVTGAVMRPLRLHDGQEIVPSVSVGVTVGEAFGDVLDLIRRADEEMLARKRQLYADGTRYRH